MARGSLAYGIGSATYLDKILEGSKRGDLFIEQRVKKSAELR
jgi:hypothetical protein